MENNGLKKDHPRKPQPRWLRILLITGGLLLIALLILVISDSFLLYSKQNNPQGDAPPLTRDATATAIATSATKPGSSATVPLVSGQTVPINGKAVYASVQFTMVSYQIKPNANKQSETSILIKLKEENIANNVSSQFVLHNYERDAHLILSDGTKTSVENYDHYTFPDVGEAHNNWIEFFTKPGTPLDGMILRFGQQDEEQINIPMTANPDLSMYNPHTYSQNKTGNIYGVDWTVSEITVKLEYFGRQAYKGRRFVIVPMVANVTSSKGYLGNAFSFIRLEGGGERVSVDNQCFYSISYAAGEIVHSTCVFDLPLETSKYTMLLLNNQDQAGTIKLDLPLV